MRVGYTKWARKTIDSEIFHSKPDKWFKIWFYIINRVNFTETSSYSRGECFLLPQEICEATKASEDQVKKFLKWARGNDMLLTERSTRGIRIRVIKYNIYQDDSTYKSTRKALEKHQRSTTIGEEGNNEINILENMSFNKEPDNPDEENIIDLDGTGEIEKEAPRKKHRKYPNAPAVLAVFENVLGKNPGYWKVNTQILLACERLSTERGLDKIKNALEYYKENRDDQYCPDVSSPLKLDQKYKSISAHKYRKINS